MCLPFQPEYPGGRQWNRGAPQLRFSPAPKVDELSHPTWDKVLSHVGGCLTAPLRSLPWAQAANIWTGADYLRCWYAAILREPFEPLPYLFLHGKENCGKTILWEAFELLVTRGVIKGDRVLRGNSEFNGELVGAILCAVEERDLGETPGRDQPNQGLRDWPHDLLAGNAKRTPSPSPIPPTGFRRQTTRAPAPSSQEIPESLCCTSRPSKQGQRFPRAKPRGNPPEFARSTTLCVRRMKPAGVSDDEGLFTSAPPNWPELLHRTPGQVRQMIKAGKLPNPQRRSGRFAWNRPAD